MNMMQPVVSDPTRETFDTRSLLAHAQQQAEDRKYEDFMIIDVDAHHYESSSYKDIWDMIEEERLMNNIFLRTNYFIHLHP